MRKAFMLVVLSALSLFCFRLSAQTFDKPTISGCLIARYRYCPDEGFNQFDIRNARLVVKGDAFRSLDYALQVDFAHTFRLLDATVRCRLFPELVVQIGQNKVPFMLENPMAPYALETVETSMAVNRYLQPAGRDIGFTVSGDLFRRKGYAIVNYTAGIYNGSGINVTDNNSQKDIVARLNINPFRPLTLSGSIYSGTVTALDSYAQSYDYQKLLFSCGLRFTTRHLNIRSEYTFATVDAVDSRSFYIVGQYWFGGFVAPTVRYDRFHYPDLTVERNTYTAGINFKPFDNLIVMADYLYVENKHSDNINRFALQVNLSF